MCQKLVNFNKTRSDVLKHLHSLLEWYIFKNRSSFSKELRVKCIFNILLVIHTYFTRNYYQLKVRSIILDVHITDLSPGMTIGNMDTTGLRWLSSFFNTPADEKDNCDEHP